MRRAVQRASLSAATHARGWATHQTVPPNPRSLGIDALHDSSRGGAGQAYHGTAACLGDTKFIPADGDDADWFCPCCSLESTLAASSAASTL